ncbi:MAG: tetratricopeptide repeat protein [Pseudomonadales bacterium]|nr:tetratricopeptide repeat protein [Pseudomonadales bacterium]MCP5182919.1 tetratricopeptide repeat protein [Pseudomonadales bacterium]
MQLGSSSSSAIVEVTPQNFQQEVAEKSRSVPVLLLFWAQQVPVSAQVKATLTGLMPSYEGKAVLALVDVARDQMLAQQLRVQSLPALRVVHDGQLVDQVDGPQSERVYKQLLDELTMSSGDMLRASLEEVLAARDFGTALQILQDSIQQEPNNPAFRVELADVLVRSGQLDDARTALASVAADVAEKKRPQNRLEFWEEAAGLDDTATLQAALDASPDDLDARYALCVRLVVDEEFEAALDLALEIMRTDRTFRDDIGRLTLIRIFDVLGKGAPLATAYRRRMFNYLH